jgi:hypothetical protein
VAGTVPLADCPTSIGPLGPFTPAPDRFHYQDGIFAAIRVRGSEHRYYEIYGGVHISPTLIFSGPTDPKLGKRGYIIVERYDSATVDRCKALRDHTTDGPFTREYDFPGLGPILRISGTGDLVTLHSASRTRNFNFVLAK